MKALMIGGTGIISTSVTRRLLEQGWEVTLLNRGQHAAVERPFDGNVRQMMADINDEARVAELLGDSIYDAVCDFIVFTPDQAARDVRLFRDHARQYVFISSASAYCKPLPRLPITEDTPLDNPYWLYSRNKAACEELLLAEHARTGFPVTIVRPSHTYCERSLPVQIHGAGGAWAVLERMMQGKRVLMVGDRNDDMRGAADCGLDAAGVLYGYGSREELEAFHPVLLAESCADLTDRLLAARV